ncbi:hypothetical protein PV05_08946 [Exophiala xenobiotica]|uniref:Uncharacterized protein n=1 Tax=Exophiala xenobiotica TaxID=348802 RepID=A0A0D2BLE8_9EURO|nr:uncharacterized protein PV05_08946 [Exophiala xenobiotica]KIW53366.1 hypothetical protein PV05_08946 [Exophiala xenobiotica]
MLQTRPQRSSLGRRQWREKGLGRTEPPRFREGYQMTVEDKLRERSWRTSVKGGTRTRCWTCYRGNKQFPSGDQAVHGAEKFVLSPAARPNHLNNHQALLLLEAWLECLLFLASMSTAKEMV